MYPLFYHPYPIPLISIVAILFTQGLAVTAPQDWNIGQKLLLEQWEDLLLFGAICSPDPSFRHEVSDVFLPSDSFTF
jgi:hypothetical protein